jgi:hypothetical protein
MKKIILILSILLNIYLFTAWSVDKQCREYLGWEFYSLYPEPMCHVELNTTTLEYLKGIQEAVPVKGSRPL